MPAQVALLSLELDAERLAKAGVIAAGSWRRLPHGGVVNRTPFVLVVRQGNPKGIHDFSDLARPGVRVVHPDPLTSGGANWAILAEYGAGRPRRRPGGPAARPATGPCAGVWRNVVAQAASARAARTQFENGFGDVLVTYEQDVLKDAARGHAAGRDRLSSAARCSRSTPWWSWTRNIAPAERAADRRPGRLPVERARRSACSCGTASAASTSG